MYINNSIGYLFSSLVDSILHYPIYIFIIISSLILLIVLLTRSSIIKYIVFCINIILFLLILINYNYHLININIFNHFIHNIYFYFLNSLLFLTINTYIMFKDKYYKFNSTIYIVCLPLLLFSLFMTYYLSNNHYLVLYNIYSEIVLGNIIYITYYLIIVLFHFIKK